MQSVTTTPTPPSARARADEPRPPAAAPVGTTRMPTSRSWPAAVSDNAAWRIVKLLLARLLRVVAVAFVVVTVVFFVLQLVPGEPLVDAVGDRTAAQLAAMREEYGLNDPVVVQYANYLQELLQGRMGRSYVTQQPVEQLIAQRAESSLSLALVSLAVVLLVGVPLGIVMGFFTREGRRRRLEIGFMSSTSLLSSIPNYLAATVLTFVLAVQFRLLPVAGGGSLKHLVLPVIAVSLAPLMTLARIVRLQTLDVIAQPYFQTARSNRLRPATIYLGYVLPNVAVASLTLGGIVFAEIIGGAVIIEKVFARAGLGTSLIDGVIGNDYPVVLGLTVTLAVGVVVLNGVIDFLLDVIDPRRRDS